MESRIDLSNLPSAISRDGPSIRQGAIHWTGQVCAFQNDPNLHTTCASVLIYRVARDNKTLKRVVLNDDKIRQIPLNQVVSTDPEISTVLFLKELLNGSEAKGAQIQSKTDSLAENLASLLLLVLKKVKAVWIARTKRKRTAHVRTSRKGVIQISLVLFKST